MVYWAIFKPESETYHVSFPDVKDIEVSGNSIEDAMHKAQTTLDRWMCSIVENKEKLPKSSGCESLSVGLGEFAMPIKVVVN